MTDQNCIKIRPPLFEDDLELIQTQLAESIEVLRNSRIFLTGGTGFFGRWLVESFLFLNRQNHLNAHLTVLSRNPSAFLQSAPHLVSTELNFIQGDVRNFEFPEANFTHIIHAATEASNQLNSENPLKMFDVIVEGTRHVLDMAVQTGAKRFLFVSSGAVYGPQPPEVSHIREDQFFGFAPNDPNVAYAEGKRAAEFLCSVYAKQHQIEIPIARCFAFVGPHLPLDAHFAIGNFINDALHNRPIHISGDGTPLRSYLYGSDLTAWLWKILIKGESNRPYNVGSDKAFSIRQLAEVVGSDSNVDIVSENQFDISNHKSQYIPEITRLMIELDCTHSIDLINSIEKTITWCNQSRVHSGTNSFALGVRPQNKFTRYISSGEKTNP